MSSGTSVNAALADYAAGRMTAQQLVGVVATAYYGEGGRGKREGLKHVVEIIERAHPGIVELASTSDQPGFAVRLSERPFPKQYETDLRAAVKATLGDGLTLPLSPIPRPGFFTRVLRAIRRVFGG